MHSRAEDALNGLDRYECIVSSESIPISVEGIDQLEIFPPPSSSELKHDYWLPFLISFCSKTMNYV